MPIRVKCACGKVLSVRDELAGKAVKCPGCQSPIRIPGGTGPVNAVAPAKAGATVKTPSAAKPSAPAKSVAPAKATAPGRAAPPAKTAGSGKPAAAAKDALPTRAAAPNKQAFPGLSAGSPTSTVDGSLDDLFNEAGLHLRTGKTCPNCMASLAADAVLCTQCGLNLTTGQKLTAHKTEFDDEQSGEAYLKRAAADMARSKQMQDKMAKGAGMPWWMLLLVLFLLGSVTTVAVIAVNMSRREEAGSFNATATMLLLAAIGMWTMGVGATLLVLYHAFKEGVWHGLASMFVPFYILYYGFTRFRTVGKPLLLSIVANIVASGLFAAYNANMQ